MHDDSCRNINTKAPIRKTLNFVMVVISFVCSFS